MAAGQGRFSGLPTFHVGRQRLLDELFSGPVAVVEAGAGYGKSVLAAEYRANLQIACAWVPLGPPDNDVSLLVASFVRAFRAAKLSDLASALGAAGPEGWADRLLDALSLTEEPLLVVLDDAHHLMGDEAAALVLRLGKGVVPPHRLLVSARRLPTALEPLRAVLGVRFLSSGDLAFDATEVEKLISQVTGQGTGDREVNALLETTGGWVSALVLAARALHAGPELARAPLDDGAQASVIASLMGPRLQILAPQEREALYQLAHLPHFSTEMAAALSGAPQILQLLVAAGVPVVRTPARTWEMPGPVAAHLAGMAPLAKATAEVALSFYGAGLNQPARHGRAPEPRERPLAGSKGLSATERAVARLVAEGYSNKAIAATLFISRKTVEFHISNIYRRLGVASRVKLAQLVLVA